MAGRTNPFADASSKSGGGSRTNPFADGDGGGGGDDKGLLDKLKHNGGNLIGDALSALDLGRAGVVSTVIELGDVARMLGGKDGFGDGERIRNRGISLQDIIDNTKSHVGVGDILEQNEVTNDLPMNVKRGLGFGGDVLLDPLTYVTFGASAPAKEGVRQGSRLISKDEIVRGLLELGDDEVVKLGGKEAVDTLANEAASGVITKEAAEAVGARTGVGIHTPSGVKTIPGTEKVTELVGRGGRLAKRGIKKPLSTELLEKLQAVPVEGIRRANAKGLGELDAARFRYAATDAANRGALAAGELSARLEEIRAKYPDVDGDTVREALEGGTREGAAGELADLFEAGAQMFETATGRTLSRKENYLTHILTPEGREKLTKAAARGDGKETFEFRRELEGTIEDLNAAAAEKFGQDAVKLFETNAWGIADAWVGMVQRAIRRGGIEQQLVDNGLAEYVEKGSVRRALRKNEKAAGRLAKRTAKAETKAAEKQALALDARATAEDLKGLVPEAPEVAARAPKKRAVAEIVTDPDGTQRVVMNEIGGEYGHILDDEHNILNLENPQHSFLAAMRAEFGPQELVRRDADGLPEVTEFTWENLDRLREIANDLRAGKKVNGVRFTDTGGSDAHLGERVADILNNLERAVPEGAGAAAAADAQDLAALVTQLREQGLVPEPKAPVVSAAPEAPAVVDPELQAMIDELPQAEAALAEAERALEFPASKAPGRDAVIRLQDAVSEAQDRVDFLKEEIPYRQSKAPATPKVAAAERVLEQEASSFDTVRRALEDPERVAAHNARDLARLEREAERAADTVSGEMHRELEYRTQAATAFDAAQAEAEPILKQIAQLEGVADVEAAKAVKLLEKAETWTAKEIPIDPAHLAAYERVINDNYVALAGQKSMYAHPEVADALMLLRENMTPKKVGGILKAHDQILSRWKAWSLLSPGYHGRNFMSAMFNNGVAGMDGSAGKAYFDFGRMIRTLNKDGLDAAMAKAPSFEYAEAFKTMHEWRTRLFDEAGGGLDASDALHSGAQTQGGVLGDLARTKGGRNLDITALDNPLIKGNFAIAGKVEKMARGPLFIDGLMKGMSPEAAYERVIKFHFDYSELSHLEKTVARRVIPFYTWMRKNFPLQIEMMAKRPGKYTRYLHAKRNIELGSEEDSVVPGYFKDLLAIRTPFKVPGAKNVDGEDASLYLTPDLPFVRLAETFDSNILLSQMSPIIKTPIETAAGKQFFSGAPFRDGYQEAPGGAAWTPILKVLQVADGKFGLPNVETHADGRLMIKDADAYKIEQFLPILGRMRRVAPTEKRYQDRVLSTWMSTFLGLGARTNGEREQQGELLRIERSLEAYAKKAEQLTKEPD